MNLSQSFQPQCFDNISMHEVLNTRNNELQRRKINIIGVKFKVVILIVCIENITVKALINSQAGPIQNVHFVADNRSICFAPRLQYTR